MNADSPHSDDPFRFLQDLIRTHGDVARYTNRFGPVCFFNHPDHVQVLLQSQNYLRTSLLSVLLGQGLLSSEGDLWKSQRRLMQPVFHDVDAFGAVVIDRTRAMLRRWDDDAGAPLDLAIEMRRLTLDIIIKALYSVDLGENLVAWDVAFSTVFEDLGALSVTQFNVPITFSPQRNAESRRALAVIDRHVAAMIADRRALEDKPHDFLSRLVLAQDDRTGLPLSDRQIRDEVVTLLIAGHETTAVALSWAWYLLAQHPEVDARLSAEVDVALDRPVTTAQDLPRLPYTRMVFEETMRLYPPVCFITRQAQSDDTVDGHAVRAKTVVLMSPWTTHRHAGFWDRPEAFDPERFSAERVRGRHRYAYFPFGGGKHQCAGQAFAMAEGQLILALVRRRYQFRPVAGHAVGSQPTITLRQTPGFLVTGERRPVRSTDV